MVELVQCWGYRADPWLLWATVWVGEGLGGGGCRAAVLFRGG